jgi:hypothetical protein
MNQMGGHVQHNLVHIHLVHTQNNMYSLTFQDDKTGREHSPDKLKWDFMDHPIGNHSALGVLIEYGALVAKNDNLAFYAHARLIKSCEAPESNNMMMGCSNR